MARTNNKDKIKGLFNDYITFIENGQKENKQATFTSLREHAYKVIDLLTPKAAKDILTEHKESGSSIILLSDTETYNNKIVEVDGAKLNPYHAGAIIFSLYSRAKSFYPVIFNELNEDKITFGKSFTFEPQIYEYAVKYVIGEEYDATYTRQLEAIFTFEAKQRLKEEYDTIPSSAITYTTKKILNSPKHLTTPTRGQLTREDDPFTAKTTITYKGSVETVIYEIENFYKKFAKQVPNGVKVFNELLRLQNDQHKDDIRFNLSDFVADTGRPIYKNTTTAYRGLTNIFSKLQDVKITIKKKRGQNDISQAGTGIILEYSVTFNECSVMLGTPIKESSRAFTRKPIWADELSDNAYALLDYIYYMARQSTDKIKEKGCFNIGIEAVRMYLGLPDPKDTHKHTEKIFNPIDDAITEIEELQQKKGKQNLTVTPIYSGVDKIKDYLAGYLEIVLDEETTAYMTERGKIKEDKIKRSIAKKENEKAKLQAKIEIEN